VRSFFDTNVLVYLFDEDAPEKKARARQLLETEVQEGRAILSTQVLQEFYVAVTRKLARPLPAEDAERAVRNLTAFPLVQVDAAMMMSAVGRSQKLQYSFWEALIIEAALIGGAHLLYSEDLQHGRKIDGLEIQNPFL
jgi:predicted nucleic acid-binding protein